MLTNAMKDKPPPTQNADQRDDHPNMKNRGWGEEGDEQPLSKAPHPFELAGQEGPLPGELSHGGRHSPGRKGVGPDSFSLSSLLPLEQQLDGSFGEGGGQILRTSLALALVTGRGICIENIRAGRQKPGLRNQHLAAVKAAARVGAAHVEGAAVGSQRLEFRPGALLPGVYECDVGSAGSATLVLQTILPALLKASGPSRVRLEGGTHNPLAPPYDFLARTYVPLLQRLGADVRTDLTRPGFAPAGGGAFTAEIQPVTAGRPLSLLERGSVRARRARALLAGLPRHIAERELAVIAGDPDWKKSERVIEECHARGPGNVVLLELECENLTLVFAEFGQKGVRAEEVAARALCQARDYMASPGAVCEYLADQLLLPMALFGGGAFTVRELSSHARTNIEVIRRFLDVDFKIENAHDLCTVTIG